MNRSCAARAVLRQIERWQPSSDADRKMKAQNIAQAKKYLADQTDPVNLSCDCEWCAA